MTNNYLEFSEVLPHLTAEEERWLREQLESVCVFGDREYAQDELPSDLDAADADWSGCRAWRDLEGHDPDDGEMIGFECEFHADQDTPDGWGRHLWLHAEEGADLERIAHLVQKFLKHFRPDQCWSLTYATTCSKPRAGEFGGGAVFVTADQVEWQNAYDFVEQCRQAFLTEQSRRQVARLARKAEESGIGSDDLDEPVHEAAASTAASVNNRGLPSQIEYLIEQFGVEETEKTLDQILADRGEATHEESC